MAVATKTTVDKTLAQLSRRFDAETEVGRREQGGKKLDYIGIDTTINRFNEVLGAEWSFTVTDTSLDQFDGFNKKGEAVKKYIAVVSGEIEALGKRAGGVGADVAEDPDKAIKTALAEALKKSSHQFGVALYLWNEDERNIIQTVRNAVAAGDELTPLKTKVMQLALDAGVEANAAKIAEHFKVTVEQLQEIPVLQEILSRG